MVKLALIANPESGSGRAADAERILRARGAEVTRHSLDEIEGALDRHPDRIVVAGGDGSVAPAAELAGGAGLPLAVIPVGTANDFARALELPDDLEEACALASEGSRTRRLDLARIDGRPFVNAASAGLSPYAARKAHGWKGALGPLAYAVGALRAGLGAEPLEVEAEVDRRPFFDGRAWQVSVAGTGAFGAGSEVEADPADGRIDVVVLEAGTRLALVRRAYGLRSGTVEEQDGVIATTGTEAVVRMSGEGEMVGFNVDGELVRSEAATFAVEPGAFEVIVG